MQNWQKTRNYRKFENVDGSITHIITVDGEDIGVGAEVFAAYSQADRRERYLAERDAGRMLSLERFAENGVTLDHLVDEHIESAEESVLCTMLKAQAMAAFKSLKPDEQDLIQAVVMDGITEQDYANTIGISQVAVHKRKKRILKKIFELVVIANLLKNGLVSSPKSCGFKHVSGEDRSRFLS